MTEAIIFDLDNCLAAADEPGREVFEPACAAIRSANRGILSEQALAAAFEDCWRYPLDWVANKYGFSDAMLQAGWEVAKYVEVIHTMTGYGDICQPGELPARLFLVTSGFRCLQESKIRALGIAAMFQSIYIDAIDEPDRKGKQGIFGEILKVHRLLPAEVLVVGDSPESEIAAGNRLGMPTVQILRPGVNRGSNARYYINGIAELKQFVQGVPPEVGLKQGLG